MYEKLPHELKERGSFCLWKYEERDGRMTKVPYQTSGLRADSTNKATFTDYAIVIYWNFIGAVEIPDEQEKTA